MHIWMRRTVLSTGGKKVTYVLLNPHFVCLDYTHMNGQEKYIQVHLSGAIRQDAECSQLPLGLLPYLLQVVGCDTIVCSVLLGMSLPDNKKAETAELSLDPVFSKN